MRQFSAQLPAQKQEVLEIEMGIQFMQSKTEKYRVQIGDLQAYNETIDKSILHEKIVADYQVRLDLNILFFK